MHTLIKEILDCRWQLFFLILLSGLFFVMNSKKWGIRFLVLWVAYSLMIYLSPIPEKLYFNFNSGIEYIPHLNLDELDVTLPYHIVVLGTAAYSDTALPPSIRLHASLQNRLMEGMRIFNKLPYSILITTGNIEGSLISHGELAALTAIDLGFSRERIDYLPEPLDTKEEAFFYHKKYGDSNPVILVTDAYHLPRARDWFSKNNSQIYLAPSTPSVKTKDDSFILRFKWSWDKAHLWNICMIELVSKVQQLIY
jgi:uncharacterized SAM-binding protein YcdF (DUF218 family)